MSEGMSAERTSSWYDDAPITDAQYAEVWDSAMAVQERPSYSRFVVRKLLVEVERLRAHLVAERLATEAAETENDRLRARLDEIGETREEWRFRDAAGWFTVSRMPLSAADIQFTKKETGHPVEHRIVGQWREVPDA